MCSWSFPVRAWNQQLNGDVQAHIDVATGGVRVRADLVSCIDKGLRICLLKTRQADVQVDVQPETARDLADADMGGDRSVVRDGAFGLAGDELQCADEAGGVAGGEQLFRVGRRAASTTEFFRSGEFDVEDVVAGNRTTVTATGGSSDCGVESLHGVSLIRVFGVLR